MRTWIVAILVAVGVPAVARGTEPSASDSWVFSATFGAGGAGGGYGSFLEKPLLLDLNASRGRAWRFGAGVQFGSLSMKSPYQDELEWGHFETYLLGGRVFRSGQSIRPYLQLRAGLARSHPRSELFITESINPGDIPTLTKAVNGFGITLQSGFELALSPGLALDVGGFWNAYRTEDYDLSPVGLGPVGDGTEWGLKAGLAWRPLAGTSASEQEHDAWGAPRSWGRASATLLGINYVVAMFTEYTRNREFTQISPRSFWENLERGFEQDDDTFKTNQLAHPWNGGVYFNSGRANGLDFWSSSSLALAGSFMWECCGETHPMSANDMVNTAVGGVTLGETLYRLSSLVLDNQATGASRVARETAAAFLNPTREGLRVFSSRAWRQGPNPESPYDKRPPDLGLRFMTGARAIGEGDSFSDSRETTGFLAVDLDFGSAWDNTRRRPFDRFDLASEWNFQDQLGRLQISGDLWSKASGSGGRPRHALALTQYYDYVDNEAYKYGGQSVGGTWFFRTNPASTTVLETRLDAYGVIIGAINADFELTRDLGQADLRRNEYGPGFGAGFGLRLLRSGRALLSARYRFNFIHASSSVFEAGEPGLESAADHSIHEGWLRLVVPVASGLGLGVDGTVFLRNSRYSSPLVEDSERWDPQLRVFLAWTGGGPRGDRRDQ
ncbi:MAG: DUF3943 domain-containing protein [Acidobacteria bacterium]|jgi:hypothetical protein|nr:DUF3943 domain-containing protein [Acidobacteriota bacterium]